MTEVTTRHQVAQFTTVLLPVLYWHRHNPGAFVIQPRYTEMGLVNNKLHREGKIVLGAVAALTPTSRGI